MGRPRSLGGFDMSRTRIGLTAALCAAVVGAWGLSGQAQQRVGERVGEKLDDAGQAIKRGAQNLAGDVREGFARTRAGVHNMGIESRVYGRIHWDKALTDAVIELSGRDDGVITLRGSVADAAAKAKA